MRSRSLLWSFNYAIEGIVFTLRTQRNMRLHALAAAVVLGGALFFRITRLELAMVLFAISCVFVAELANTAIEAAVDVATDTFDPMAKTAKDVAAGAVLIASLDAVAVGYLVFFKRLTSVTTTVLSRVREAPSHLTVIALALTALAVLVGKALGREGTWLQGGWPSGHTALATAAAAAVGYASGRADATVLALFIAALVAQSRVESETHTIPQVIIGALLGLLLATIVFQVSWH
ncbi:MAG: diacylglycerol kinase [Coriobacteriia bacterium]